MTSFMGPMAPPPAAPAQPQALDIRTDPNRRQQFKQFMKQRTSMAPMVSAPIAQPQPPMPMMQSPTMFNMGGGVDIFDPMYSAPMMAPSAPMGFDDGGAVPSTLPRSKRDAIAQKVAEMMAIDAERVRAAQQNAEYNRLLRDQDAIDRQVALDRLRADQAESRQDMTLDSILSDIDYERRGLLRKEDGGAVPPRRTDIRGQDHMLSYITPDEADILMALGGSGEAGPMGIPSYIPDDGNRGGGDFGGAPSGPSGGSSGGGGGSSGDPSGGDDRGNDGGGMSPGRSQAQFGTTEFAGKSEQEAQNIVDSGGGSDQAQAVQQSIATQQRADAQRAAEQAERQRVDQLVRDAVSGSASARQGLIDQRSPQVQAEIDQLKSDPANLGPAGQLLADIRSAPTTSTGIASTATGLRDTRGPDAGRLDLLDIDDLLTDQFTERDLVTDAAPSGVSRAGTLGQTDAYKSAMDRRSDERSMNPADFEAQYGVAPRGVTENLLSETPSIGIMSPDDFLNTDDMSRVNISPLDQSDIGAAGLGVDVPTSTATTTTPTGPTTSAPIGMDDEYDDITDPKDEFYDDLNREGYSAGLPTGLDFVDTPQGRMTTNLAGTTAAQRADMPGYMNTRKEDGTLRDGIAAGLTDFAFGNPVRNAYGFEIPDLATGQITGMTGPSNMPGMIGSGINFLQDLFMGPPKNTEDLLQRGVYTGFGPGSQIGMEEGGEDQPVKAPTDPCPDGFVMKNGACTPIDSGSGETPPNQIGGGTPPAYVAPPVIVPSPRQPVQTNLQGPVGYGSPIAGQAAPSVASNAAMYQQMLNQQAMNPPQFMPVRLQQGGAVSSNLDMAADNFLKALMPAA